MDAIDGDVEGLSVERIRLGVAAPALGEAVVSRRDPFVVEHGSLTISRAVILSEAKDLKMRNLRF
jgi:hypothetical protein